MDCSMPGLPVHHQLPEFTQTHAYCVGDSIQPSHPLLSPSPPSFSLSQHQGLFKWVQLFTSGGQRIGVSASTSVLPMNIEGWFPSGWTGWISLQSRGLSRVFSNTTVQKHQFFCAQLSLWANSHIHTWLLEKPSILAWKIPWLEERGRLQPMELLRVRHDWVTSLSLFFSHIHTWLLEKP